MRYLKNAWYAAAWSSEIDASKPFGRRIMDEPIVLFRGPEGRVHALHDRCPHRFVPLSGGKICDATLQCPYHGLCFDGDGHCIRNPHGDGAIPKAAVVKTFPAVERFGLVWLWMGRRELADPALLPNFDFLEDDRWVNVSGYVYGSGYYELFTDNILDLGHAEFLHEGLKAPAFTIGKREVYQDGNTVWSNVSHPNDYISDIMNNIFGTHGQKLDAWTDVQWTPPASMSLLSYYADPGQPKDTGRRHTSVHVMTPESEHATHYFWAFGRDVRPDDEAFSNQIRAGIASAFENEDKPMIAIQQAQIGAQDLMSLSPVLLAGDAGAVLARRVLRQLIAAEESA